MPRRFNVSRSARRSGLFADDRVLLSYLVTGQDTGRISSEKTNEIRRKYLSSPFHLEFMVNLNSRDNMTISERREKVPKGYESNLKRREKLCKVPKILGKSCYF